MLSEKRWIELQFIMLCQDLYRMTKNYIMTTNYIEFLAEAAEINKYDTMALLQKIFNNKDKEFSLGEFIRVGRQNKCLTRKLVSKLHLSKNTYIYFLHQTQPDTEYPPKYTNEEREIMLKLVTAHNIFKNAGVGGRDK